MATLLTHFRQRRGLGESGQGMTEYAATTTILLMGALGVGGGWPFFSQFIQAFENYLESIYYTLNLALP